MFNVRWATCFGTTNSSSGIRNYNIQGTPGVKVSISGLNSRADTEPKTTYTQESNSQRFRSFEFL